MDVQERYREFLDSPRGARLYNEFKLLLYGPNDTLVQTIYPPVGRSLPDGDCRILDVGGADGKRLKHNMHLLGEDGHHVSATLVEPSEAFIDTFDPGRFEIFPVHSRYEDYQPEGQYDLALFIQSFFTFRDDGYVRKTREHLADDGLVAIVGNQEGSFLGGLKRILDPGLGGSRREISQVLEDLELNGFSYETHEFSTRFGGVLENGRLTRQGGHFLEWMALRNPSELPREVYRSAVDYIAEHSHDGRITEDEILVTAQR